MDGIRIFLRVLLGFGAVFLPESGPGLIPFQAQSQDNVPSLDQFTQEIRIASNNWPKKPKLDGGLKQSTRGKWKPFATSFVPNDGVGLARIEFIITSHVGVHPGLDQTTGTAFDVVLTALGAENGCRETHGQGRLAHRVGPREQIRLGRRRHLPSKQLHHPLVPDHAVEGIAHRLNNPMTSSSSSPTGLVPSSSATRPASDRARSRYASITDFWNSTLSLPIRSGRC